MGGGWTGEFRPLIGGRFHKDIFDDAAAWRIENERKKRGNG